eukprot:107665-Amphidinium_carterae.1
MAPCVSAFFHFKLCWRWTRKRTIVEMCRKFLQSKPRLRLKKHFKCKAKVTFIRVKSCRSDSGFRCWHSQSNHFHEVLGCLEEAGGLVNPVSRNLSWANVGQQDDR